MSLPDPTSCSWRAAGGAAPEDPVLRGTGLEGAVPSAGRGGALEAGPAGQEREGWRTGLEPATTGTTTRGSTN